MYNTWTSTKPEKKFQNFLSTHAKAKLGLQNALRHRRFHESLHEGIISLQTLSFLEGLAQCLRFMAQLPDSRIVKTKLVLKVPFTADINHAIF